MDREEHGSFRLLLVRGSDLGIIDNWPIDVADR
jgi:hypothetical protein